METTITGVIYGIYRDKLSLRLFSGVYIRIMVVEVSQRRGVLVHQKGSPLMWTLLQKFLSVVNRGPGRSLPRTPSPNAHFPASPILAQIRVSRQGELIPCATLHELSE